MMIVLIFNSYVFYLGIYDRKMCAKYFESETKMINLYGDIIVPQFREFNYVREVGSNPDLILH